MRIAIASAFAYGVCFWRRLVDEGHEVMVWIGDPKTKRMNTEARTVGCGIVPRTDSWYALLAWAAAGVRARTPTLMFFDSSGLGERADEARKAGLHVIGGAKICDRLEKDRAFGAVIAQRAGCDLPPNQNFTTIDETLKAARTLDRPVYFKCDADLGCDTTHSADTPEELIEYLESFKREHGNNRANRLEEKIDGIAISTARWWNGRAFIGPYEGTFERKKLMSGEIGPATGCAFNAVWMYSADEPQMAEKLSFDALTESFLKYECPPGIYDINSVVSDGEAYFLEFSPRIGYDADALALCTLYDDLGAWLWHVATGQGDGGGIVMDEIAYSVRLGVPPYPFEHVKRDDEGAPTQLPIRGDTGSLWKPPFLAYELKYAEENGLCCATSDGVVGMSAAVGNSVEKLHHDTLQFAKKRLRVPGLMYRHDGGECIVEDALRAEEEGISDLPEALVS
jgi:phosphoribosylamine---glycine ligase